MDAADAFVHAATRAFAHRTPCPPAPADEEWVGRSVKAGVLAPVTRALELAGHSLPTRVAHVRASATARDMQTVADLQVLAKVLADGDVAWVVLKGIVLRDVVFEQPNVRDFADLDLLVAPGDIRRTIGLLEAAGASVSPADWPHYLRHRTAEMTMVLRHGTVLDLHWNLVNEGALRDRLRLPTETLLARRRPIVVADVEMWTLDELDFALHVIVHACTSGCSELRWLLDVQQVIRALGDGPDALAARAVEWGVTPHVRVVLESVVRFLDPGLVPWVEAMGRRTPWVRFLARLSRRRPPSTPSVHKDAARNWYRATRSVGRASAVAATAMLVQGVQHRRGREVVLEPRPVGLDDPHLERWLEHAEAQSAGGQSR